MRLNTETELEFAADKIIRETKAYAGDYPAYSERDLRRKIQQHGEILMSDIVSSPVSGRSDGWSKSPNSPLDLCQPLWDAGIPSDAELPVKPGYDILAYVLLYASGLTPLRRLLAACALTGLSLRDIERTYGIPKSTAARQLESATEQMRRRRTELEQEYDLPRTAFLLALQRAHLSPANPETSEDIVSQLFHDYVYRREVKRIVADSQGAVPVSVGRRNPVDLAYVKKIARSLEATSAPEEETSGSRDGKQVCGPRSRTSHSRM